MEFLNSIVFPFVYCSSLSEVESLTAYKPKLNKNDSWPILLTIRKLKPLRLESHSQVSMRYQNNYICIFDISPIPYIIIIRDDVIEYGTVKTRSTCLVELRNW